MFYSCSNLRSLDVSNFNTKEVTNMRAMFNGCRAVQEIKAVKFDTSKVTVMDGMFLNTGNGSAEFTKNEPKVTKKGK